MDFESHYANQQADTQNTQDELRIRQYNTWVGLVRKLAEKMVRNARTSPPSTCNWVYEGGEKKVSWELWREYDDTSRINLLPAGRLVFVEGSYYSHSRPDHIARDVTLREVSRVQEQEERDIDWNILADLYSNIVTMRLSLFGLESPGDLHGAILQHWGSSWSKYR